MAFLLKLNELTGTASELDFLADSGDPHLHLADGGLSIPAPKQQRVWGGKSIYSSGERLYEANYGNRIITLEFAIHGSTRDKIAEGWRDIVRACQDIQNYAMDFAGNHWELQYQADGAADTTYFDPLDAIADVPGGFLSLENMFWQDADSYYVLHNCTLSLTCKPFARGDVIEMENLLLNPSFEHWNNGFTDSQPDNWDDYSSGVTGTNNREATNIQHGLYSLKIDAVSGTGYQGVKQDVTTTDGFVEPGEDYTVIAWIKNTAITNGEMRIYFYGVNTGYQYLLQSAAANDDFTRYAKKFTLHASETTMQIIAGIWSVGPSGVSGTAYVDKLIFLKGDYESASINPIAYMTGSLITNHFDADAGDLNYCDIADMLGDIPARARTIVKLKASSGDTKLRMFRLAKRRYPNIFNLEFFQIPPFGGTDTNCANGSYIHSGTLSTSWKEVYSFTIADNVDDQLGKFRVLARLYDESGGAAGTLQIRATHWMGTEGAADITNTYVASPVTGDYYISDLGISDFSGHGGDLTPNNVGVRIEAKRTTGTDGCRIDYVCLMPLDGDYISIKSPVLLSNSDELIVDNISDNFPVIAKAVTGVHPIPPPPQTAGSFHSRGDLLYVACVSGAGGNVYSWDGLQWASLGEPSATAGAMSISEYQGELYTGHTDGNIYAYRSGAWVNIGDVGTQARTMHPYGTKLYIGTGNANGDVYECDGSAVSLTGATAAGNVLYCSEAHGDYIYFGGTNGKIYKYQTGGSVTEDYDTGAGNTVMLLQEAHGYLYAGTDTDHKIFRLAEGSWSQISDNTDGTMDTQESASINDVLYYHVLVGGSRRLYYTSDGTTYNWVALNPAIINGIGAHAGRVFAGGTGPAVDQYIPRDLWQAVPDIVGIPLTFLPDIDQRLICSVDRNGDINNIDDSIYVRIYYEPRFLHVRVD